MTHVPPHDINAERAVLSAAILSSDARDTVLGMLTAEAYYEDRHRIVHRALNSLVDRGIAVDVVTVMNWIRDRDLVQRVGGATYIGEMLDASPAIVHVAEHCELVKGKHTYRRAIEICQRFAGDGYSSAETVKDFIGRLEQAVFELSQSKDGSEPRSLRDALQEGFTNIQNALNSGSSLLGLSTGLELLDQCITGLHPGDVYVIGARPGMGKSALAMGMALAGARNHSDREQTGTAVFSLEMPDVMLAIRALCAEAMVSLHSTRTLQFQNDELKKLAGACDRVAGLPIQLDDTAAIGLHDLRAKTRRMATNLKRDHGVELGLIIVDYLQLMSGPGQSREAEVSAISRGLKRIAKEFSVPVVALAQLNRGVESRQNKRPMLSDLRESGGIEQDADAVIFIYRDDYYVRNSKDAGIAELIVAKQRNGPTGTVQVAWDAKTTTFRNLQPEWHAQGQYA